MGASEYEDDCIRKAIAGDRSSLSELLLAHYDELRDFVRRRISGELQSLVREEDVLHQTFVRAARGIENYEVRRPGSFRAWLRTIAANLIRDAQRRRRRERRADDGRLGARSPGSRGARNLVERLAASGSTPSRRIQLRENLRCMKAALASLPDDQRELLERYYLRDESLDEIARATQRTKDAVRGACYRARRNLRALMGHSSLYFSG